MCLMSEFATAVCVNRYMHLPAAGSTCKWDRWPILSLTQALAATGLRKMAWLARPRGREYHDASWRIVSYGPRLLVFTPVSSALWTSLLSAAALTWALLWCGELQRLKA